MPRIPWIPVDQSPVPIAPPTYRPFPEEVEELKRQVDSLSTRINNQDREIKRLRQEVQNDRRKKA